MHAGKTCMVSANKTGSAAAVHVIAPRCQPTELGEVCQNVTSYYQR